MSALADRRDGLPEVRGLGVVALARDLISLAKPRLSSMVLVTTAGGYVLAPGTVTAWDTLKVVFATALLVASANTLNCVLEADTDRRMQRTRARALAAGRVPVAFGLLHGIVLAAIALPLLSQHGNALAALLGALAHFTYVAIYTPMKRWSSLATIVGAVPGALPPLIGWTAATGRLDLPGLVLFAVLFFWQIPHFLALSMMLRDDYARAGLKVLTLDGGADSTRVNAVRWTLALIPTTLLLVPLGVAGPVYGAGALIAGLAFLAAALFGVRESAGRRGPTRLFFASILYLPVLFALLALDARG